MLSRKQCEAIARLPGLARQFDAIPSGETAGLIQIGMLHSEIVILHAALEDTLTREEHNVARAERLVHAIVEYIQAEDNLRVSSIREQCATDVPLAELYLIDCFEFLRLLARCSTPRFGG